MTVAASMEAGVVKVPGPPSNKGDIEEEIAQPTTSTKPRLFSKKSSVLAASDDPFAPREGKTLLWRNVNMTLVSPRRYCAETCDISHAL